MFLRNARALALAVRQQISSSRLAVPAGLAITLAPVAGCGAAAAPTVTLPAKASAPATIPAAPSSAPLTPRQVVEADYAGYWTAYAQAMTAGTPAGARAILSPYATPATIPSLISALRKVWAAREVASGAAVTHPLSVQVTGSRALLHDCLDLSHFGVASRATGLVVSDSFGLPNRNFYVTLLLAGGRWRVSNMQPVEVPCTP
jgi:hypothetical protein